MSSLLLEIESIVEATPARPLQDTLADLDELAHNQPESPLPPMASVIVSGFAHTDLSEAKTHLERTGELLQQAPPADPLVQFTQALYDIVVAQFNVLVIMPWPIDEAAALAATPAFAAEKKKTLNALQRIADLVASGELGTTSLPNTLVGMIQTQDRTIELDDPSFAIGISTLDQQRSSGATSNLAALFLLYAYRRAHKYPDAIQVGLDLEKKLPNSAMVKHAIGTAYFHWFDDVNSERYYNSAKALAPSEPSIPLSMASLYARKGDVDKAAQCADEVAALDPEGKLAVYRERVLAVIARKRLLRDEMKK